MIPPWGDSIPEDWEVTPLKHLTKTVTGGTPNRSDASFWEGSIPWVSSKDMKEGELVDTEEHVTQKAIEEGETTLVPKGSLLMVSRSGILEHSIPVAVANRELAINQDIRAYIPKGNIRSRYLRNLFIGFEDDLLQLWKQQGATVQSLNSVAVSETQIPVPSIETQRSIITYCETKAKNIDSLVQKYDKLDTLLETQRQAIIDDLVSNGVSESEQVEAALFGIESLPRDWEKIRLKFLLNGIEQGWSPQCNEIPASEDQWGVLKTGCVNHMSFDSTENKQLPADLEPKPELEIKQGDVLMSRANTRDLVGSCAMAENPDSKLILCDKLYRLDVDDSICSPKYIVYALNSSFSRNQIELDASGASSSMVNISQEFVGNMEIPHPPLEEQKQIDRILDRRVQKINNIQEHIISVIDLLREKRETLMTRATTGQIDFNHQNTLPVN